MVASQKREIEFLPLEIWVKIFSYLSGPDLFRCEAVCKDWRQEIHYQVITRETDLKTRDDARVVGLETREDDHA